MFWEASAYLFHQLPWFWPLVGGILGGVIGSFLSCAAHRLPRGLSMRQPPSQCPSCQKVLKVPDLIPILSYLALRGRCRFCQAAIPRRTLLLEIASTALGILLAYAWASVLFSHTPSPLS